MSEAEHRKLDNFEQSQSAPEPSAPPSEPGPVILENPNG